MIASQNVVINEDGGIAMIIVDLLNEIENDFTLSYSTADVPNGAEGVFYLYCICFYICFVSNRG